MNTIVIIQIKMLSLVSQSISSVILVSLRYRYSFLKYFELVFILLFFVLILKC